MYLWLVQSYEQIEHSSRKSAKTHLQFGWHRFRLQTSPLLECCGTSITRYNILGILSHHLPVTFLFAFPQTNGNRLSWPNDWFKHSTVTHLSTNQGQYSLTLLIALKYDRPTATVSLTRRCVLLCAADIDMIQSPYGPSVLEKAIRRLVTVED